MKNTNWYKKANENPYLNFKSPRSEGWVAPSGSVEESLGKEKLDILDEVSAISERLKKIEPEYLALKNRLQELDRRMRELMR